MKQHSQWAELPLQGQMVTWFSGLMIYTWVTTLIQCNQAAWTANMRLNKSLMKIWTKLREMGQETRRALRSTPQHSTSQIYSRWIKPKYLQLHIRTPKFQTSTKKKKWLSNETLWTFLARTARFWPCIRAASIICLLTDKFRFLYALMQPRVTNQLNLTSISIDHKLRKLLTYLIKTIPTITLLQAYLPTS